MKPINLYSLAKIADIEAFSLYRQKASQLEEMPETRTHEQGSLIRLVSEMIKRGCGISSFEDFYFGYAIPQIGKEFDLLKITETQVLNIELKSEEVDFAKIEKQLVRNRYYLQYLGRYIKQYTYVASTGDVYTINEQGVLEYSNIESIAESANCMEGKTGIDIGGLFRVSDFLISPLNTPDKFLENQYFLTKQQEEFERAIISYMRMGTYKFYAISGAAGTGKTLLLYDIAKLCGSYGRCCLIHCGTLSEGHIYLNQKLSSIDIIAAKDLRGGYDFSSYDYIFVDEAQRIYTSAFELIVDSVQSGNKMCVWSFDSNQILSQKEQNRNIRSHIEALPSAHSFFLTGKIRTNKEMADFLKSLWDLNEAKDAGKHPNVDVVYADTAEEVTNYLHFYEQKGFTFINYTPSLFQRGNFDQFDRDNHLSTHFVVGQEFDNVIMIMDNNFFHDENGFLKTYSHPNPDYLYRQLLFQGLSRVREKLCIIVFGNQALFKNILRLL